MNQYIYKVEFRRHSVYHSRAKSDASELPKDEDGFLEKLNQIDGQ